jgi:hypothetical protein
MAHPIVRALVQITSLGVVGIIVFVAYAEVAEHRAEEHARAFCDATRVGENADSVFARATKADADQRQTRWIETAGQPRWLAVTFTGFTPISRHICSVEAGDIVKQARYVYLD